MKWGGYIFLVILLSMSWELFAQQALASEVPSPKVWENQGAVRRQIKGQSHQELKWDAHRLSVKSKGYPEISAWHPGTTGIIASDGAEISLLGQTRIGFTKKTELLFRVAEEPFVPNIGLKHFWIGNTHLSFGSEHALYYTYPGLRILQHTGFKGLVPDSVRIGQGVAMRHELLFSWLINPSVWGCPKPPSEKILTLRMGTEFYIGFGNSEVRPFDYAYSLYHTQILDGKVLYYGGLQFDSYFGKRMHYSVNGLYYNVDLKEGYAFETNLRLTCYVSRHWGVSLAGKMACIGIEEDKKFTCVPFLDLTYLVRPGRSTIQHGLFKNSHRKRR